MVVKNPNTGAQLCIGTEFVTVPRMRPALESAEAWGCDFIVSPLVHPRYDRVYQRPSNGKESRAPVIERTTPLTRSDMELSVGEWIDAVIGKFSRWINPDAGSLRSRSLSQQAFVEEYDLACHLSLKAMITPPITSFGACDNLAQCINSALSRNSQTQIWVRIPVSFSDLEGEVSEVGQDIHTAWDIWNHIRTLCDAHSGLGVALELTSNLASKTTIERWFGEPVQLLIIAATAFVTNKAGYPVLQKKHKEFVINMFKYNCLFSISERIGKAHGDEGVKPFVMFLAHLFGKQTSSSEDYDAPYLDYLRSPLQPLSENLENSIYAVFEQDPVKYARYQKAVELFLARRKSDRTVIMLLGAGRGPLVDACLSASADTGKPVFIYAIEKNPNAVNTLRNRQEQEDWSNVKVIATDMRLWNPPEKADLVLSELLGSFGDNELSPECLADVHTFLNDFGVCIPQSSTSYLAPLSSQLLHTNVRNLGGSTTDFETPYVVRIHRGVCIDAAKECFKFEHPETKSPQDHSRYAHITFDISQSFLLHGFAGYFEAYLYDGVDLSIRPETHTQKMGSWYPIYFPIKNPILLKKGSTLHVHLWRRTSPRHVWYEWCVSQPVASPIHNVNGRSFKMQVDTAT